MEAFYDGDLKDIWDSDLDPTESLKISTDHDMSEDWFLERDVKESVVILNDRLISDALLNGTLPPIKTEHSYSLASDGDSLPDSPHSLQAKMDDIDDECYPAISLKTATSNLRSAIAATATIDPKCLTLHTPASMNCTAQLSLPTLSSGSSMRSSSSNALLSNTTPATTFGLSQQQLSSGSSSNVFGRLSNSALNWRTLEQTSVGSNHKSATFEQQQQQQQQHSLPLLPQKHEAVSMYENDCSSSVSTREGSISPDICSDIEIDESCIKDEPMSPNSSCPASPKSHSSELSSANAASLCYTTTKMNEHGYEQKNGLQLPHSSQSYLKAQQFLLGSAQNTHNLMLPKINIKNEKQSANIQITTTTNSPQLKNNNNNNNSSAYGIPLTPPPSLPSDESEGNLTPEHLFSPLSPNTSVSISVATLAANGSPTTTSEQQTSRRHHNNSNSSSCSNSSNNGNGATTSQGRNSGASSTSTRQPIHTPLISTQPKGSTGTLLLTEEEKRTLLAEGYPIPQKLPLTKAEEKSLKKIRRKIKNKISAQESRRKKKEYMDQLERRVDILVNENVDYKKRVETLENTNANLLSQLHKLQALVNKQNANVNNNKKA